jgi:hypothetical protein
MSLGPISGAIGSAHFPGTSAASGAGIAATK